MTDLYAVMGNPISHSKSPEIHALFAQQVGDCLSYEAILVDLDDFGGAVARFREAGGKGLNVTVPFKETAWASASRRQPRAEAAGAVNTIWFGESGQIIGDNTDGVGLVRDLANSLELEIRDKRVLLLGAGGAARGALEALVDQRPAALTIANRTASKAHALADKFDGILPVVGLGFDELGSARFDLVVNATAASLAGDVPAVPQTALAEDACCYDMMYGPVATPFLEWAQEVGVHRYADGLGMLVEQAAEAFYLWRGTRPETRPVLRQLRGEVCN